MQENIVQEEPPASITARRNGRAIKEITASIAPDPPAETVPPVAAVAERATAEEAEEFHAAYAEFQRRQATAQEAERQAVQAAAEMRDAAAVCRHVNARLGRKYGLRDGDRIEDDGTIVRAARTE